jgi:EmrB/QacA subfamily drug resistance transporter
MKPYYLENSKFRIWLMLTAMCLAIFSAAFNTTSVMNALVAMNDSLHFSATSMQWLVNAYLLASASFIVVGGQLGDMFGRRRIFLMGAGGFIIASLIIAISHNPTLTIVGRALQGLSAAILTPGTLAMIKVGFPENLQSLGIGIWTSAIGLGFAFGPVISGIFTTYASWRWIFWSNVPLMLFAMVVARLFAQPTHGEKENIPMDSYGLILLVCGLVPFTLGLVEGNVWGWLSLPTLGLLIGGIIILIIFWVVEHKVNSPLVHFHHFREKIFIAGNLGIGVSAFVLLGCLYFFNTLIQNPVLFHYSPLQAGLALLPMSISMFVVSFIAPLITRRVGFRAPMAIAFIILAIACWLLHDLSMTSTYHNMWLPLLLFGSGLAVCFSSSSALGLSALPREKAGEGAGVINTINYYAGVLCVAIGTLISVYNGNSALQQMQSFSDVMLLCTIASIIGAIGIWIFAVRKKL